MYACLCRVAKLTGDRAWFAELCEVEWRRVRVYAIFGETR